MMTTTTSSSSRVKPRVLFMCAPSLRLSVDPGAQVRGAVLAARGVLHHDRRADQHLAAGVEARPVVVAELRVVEVARRVEADRAAVVRLLRAVDPGAEEAARVERLAPLEHEVHPAAERDRDARL